MERDFLKSGGLLREGDLDVKFEFTDAEKAHFPVDIMCQQMGVSRLGYPASRFITAMRLARQVRPRLRALLYARSLSANRPEVR
jgi:hypothetical protein